MRLDVTFSENTKKMDVTFEQLKITPEGGYDHGYENGYREGFMNGHAEGKTDGYTEGKTDGYSEGYVEGAKSEYDNFWDNYQGNGQRTVWKNAFYGDYWNDKTFKPKHNINVVNGNYMFSESDITDLVAILEDCNVTMSFRYCNNYNYIAQASRITRLPNIDMNNTARNVGSAFSSAGLLTSLSFSNVHENTEWNRTFEGCSSLTDLTFGGVIGKNISLQWSNKLTHDSLMSLINALKDYSGTTTNPTVTIGTTNLAKLTEEEIAIAENKGWSIK